MIVKIVFAIVFGICIILGCVYGYIYLFRDAAPRMAEAEREVFVNTPSYVNGKIDELSKMKRQFEAEKDPVIRKALREEALLAAGTVDNNKLPIVLRNWIQYLERNPIIIKENTK